MLYGSALYNRMEREYESKLDAGDYEECSEDCENCDNEDCDLWLEYHRESEDEDEN